MKPIPKLDWRDVVCWAAMATMVVVILLLSYRLVFATRQHSPQPVPGVLFTLHIMDSPSAVYGWDYWRPVIQSDCATMGGRLDWKPYPRKYTLDDGRRIPIRVITVECIRVERDQA